MDAQERTRLTLLEVFDGTFSLYFCVCGTTKRIRTRNVDRGVTRSCGCLQKERTSTTKKTHGHSVGKSITPEFQAYRSMLARCYRKSNNRYPYYGARGIEVCAHWRNSFENFLTDMGPRPSSRHSIERINNSESYAPQNCRWATRSEQGRNKRSNLIVHPHGVSMTLVEAAERFKIKYTTLKARVFKYGWDHTLAVTEPARA